MTTGVLVMAYGTPESPDEIGAFYTDIRRGRPPTAAQLAELRSRYAAIGGVSPLAQRTAAQVAAIAKALDEEAPGHFRTAYGAKHSDPKIEVAVDRLADKGVSAIVGLVLAPHYSVASVGEYIERARTRAAARGVAVAFVERWGAESELVELLAGRTAAAIASLGRRPAPGIEVVFTAHSLPAWILSRGDRYPEEVAETAALVAARLGLVRWRTGWQSAGRTEEPWLGPDIVETLGVIASEGARAVVVCAIGFTSDHLEVCYDLDVVAAARAAELGLGFVRAASLNDDPRLAGLLARLAVAADPDPGTRS
ncbi:MAG TPA: ferrochelatase [Acidimicrobiales bacterium]|nr:ferrochelatase [Acidimicrobiales bacterium]